MVRVCGRGPGDERREVRLRGVRKSVNRQTVPPRTRLARRDST